MSDPKRDEFISLLDAYVEAISHETYLRGDNCFPSQKEVDAAVQEVEDSRGLVQLAYDEAVAGRQAALQQLDRSNASISEAISKLYAVLERLR